LLTDKQINNDENISSTVWRCISSVAVLHCGVCH